MDESMNSIPEEDSTIKKEVEDIGFRDGNLFIVDGTTAMFQTETTLAKCPFAKCLRAYKRILSQKLTWNTKDWMGLIVFGTEMWDTDPEIKYVKTVQRFQEVFTDMHIEAIDILENNLEFYKSLASETAYPLYNALSHAARIFDSVKVVMPIRRVILLTCNDNPLSQDEAERHRLRQKVKSYQYMNVNLTVVGLSEDWDNELFYKDISVLANNIKEEDFKSARLKDLEDEIQFPARTSGTVMFKIAEDVSLQTTISSFSCKTKYLKKAPMDSETNEILDVHRTYRNTSEFSDESGDESDEEAIVDEKLDNIRKVVEYGGQTLVFLPKEVQKIRVSLNPGVELIGFKGRFEDITFHIKGPKFLAVAAAASEEEKQLFATLLTKCEEKGVVGICTVTLRAGVYLATLIPAIRYGGFYLYKLAYSDQINNLSSCIQEYIFDLNNPSYGPDDESVHLMKKIIKKLILKWSANMFKNPKLQAQLEYLQALALDKEATAPKDSTLLDEDRLSDRLGNLVTQFKEMFPDLNAALLPLRSRAAEGPQAKEFRLDPEIIREIVGSGKLCACTVTELRTYARSLNLSSSGNKSALLDKITNYFEH